MCVIPTKLNSKGKKVTRKKKKRIHKPKGFQAQFPGHCMAFDTIEKFIDGYKREHKKVGGIYAAFCSPQTFT